MILLFLIGTHMHTYIATPLGLIDPSLKKKKARYHIALKPLWLPSLNYTFSSVNMVDEMRSDEVDEMA